MGIALVVQPNHNSVVLVVPTITYSFQKIAMWKWSLWSKETKIDAKALAKGLMNVTLLPRHSLSLNDLFVLIVSPLSMIFFLVCLCFIIFIRLCTLRFSMLEMNKFVDCEVFVYFYISIWKLYTYMYVFDLEADRCCVVFL